ncbi:hypothetical protein L873DRAFT_1328002 [Choiromyces venosus 120613-1]|uniref:Uncharacterized protein n=1 Tax=Choiromyces venosus 120613-1 TaxID=1336337 RepID=A0A3N4JAR8_9PEZI|nr:hypothetical protein L873DRAFT_1328002 [Choiromyces venosus 120613-1]
MAVLSASVRWNLTASWDWSWSVGTESRVVMGIYILTLPALSPILLLPLPSTPPSNSSSSSSSLFFRIATFAVVHQSTIPVNPLQEEKNQKTNRYDTAKNSFLPFVPSLPFPSLLPSFPPSLLPSFPPSLLPSFPPSLLLFLPSLRHSH